MRDGYGEGRVLVGADQALALGMIDRIGTLQDTLARVTSPTGLARGALGAPSAVTDQEQLPRAAAATSQEPRIVRDPALIEFERRELALLR